MARPNSLDRNEMGQFSGKLLADKRVNPVVARIITDANGVVANSRGVGGNSHGIGTQRIGDQSGFDSHRHEQFSQTNCAQWTVRFRGWRISLWYEESSHNGDPCPSRQVNRRVIQMFETQDPQFALSTNQSTSSWVAANDLFELGDGGSKRGFVADHENPASSVDILQALPENTQVLSGSHPWEHHFFGFLVLRKPFALSVS
jgi:hypothetical protein